MQHPEVDHSQAVIGWQPVYSTNAQPKTQQGETSFLLWGICIAVTVLALGASGGLLWNKAQKSQAQVDAEIQQALVNQRARITECIAQTEPASQKRTGRSSSQ
ncbi:hypothetical protein [Dendronalium sp. ChiSLP03b]|uniref:hypothetical protein n=1 Tax=Dendronalium sp. ChiSLP03b TaxID=3075381 RepID=UPI00391A3968